MSTSTARTPGAVPAHPTTTSFTTTYQRTDMNLIHEELARAQMAARLGEAQAQRRVRSVVAARRLSRRAERAARRARVAAARL